MAGTSHGTVAAFERDSDSKPYRLAKSFAVDAPHSSAGGAAAGLAPGEASAALEGSPVVAVCSLAVSPADESIALLTSDCRLLQLAVPPGGRRALFSGLQPLGPGFHAGEITGLATCVRRPVVATCGADRTLRLWNWQDGRAELVRRGRGRLVCVCVCVWRCGSLCRKAGGAAGQTETRCLACHAVPAPAVLRR